ncbi:MAG TPA: AAA family ATPase [Pyrinomonadaceae bacterium]|nr:AAA family ATPase [Pyrinomonadaceae bacterium]
MPSLLFIGGAPGSGKTTVSRLLHEKFQSVMIDFGTLREFHLDNLWTKQSEKEEQIAFENLVFILKNYIHNGYKNVIVNDLKDFRIEQIPNIFAPEDYLIVTLVLYDDDELRARVLNPTRDSGWRDAERAVAWNRAVIERPTVANEFKLDNTLKTPEEAVREIIDLICSKIN